MEIADTPEKRRIGLMHRQRLRSNEGMIFIYDRESIQRFWMKNTYINLDLGFFNKDRELVEVQSMDGLTSPHQEKIPSVSSQSPVQFVLEVNKGWFRKK